MRIVQAVAWYFPETQGGTEVYVAALSRRLREAGHEVLIAAPDAASAAERDYAHEGIPVYRYPIPARPTRDEAQGRVPARGAERFHAWLRARRPDVVHVHTFSTGLGVHEVDAAADAGARVVVTTHSSALGYACQRGTLMRGGREPCDGVPAPSKCAPCALAARGLAGPLAGLAGAIPPALGRAGRRIPGRLGTALSMSALIAENQARQARVFGTARRFVVLTRWALDALAAGGAPRDKLALNRLGLGQRGVRPKPGPDARPTVKPVTVGYLGRFDPVKGVRDLARAVASLPRGVPLRVELRGPAGGDAEARERDRVRALAGGDPRVSWAPAVPAEEAPRVLAGYDVLCCPSVCHEGGPTVAIEAHAVGTPVIGTRIGGLAEMVTDGVNGRLVAPGDWEALAAVLAAVAGDPASTVDRWRRALPRARTMDEVAADYLAVYAA